MKCQNLRLGMAGPIAFICCAMLAACEGAVGTAQSDISCTLAVDSSSPQYPATVTVAKLTERTVKLYKVFLPTDGLSLVDMFTIQRDGKPLRYEGAMAKLPATPSAEDFVSVPPHGRVVATIPLKQNYEVGQPGRYSVKYRVTHPQPGGGALEIVSNEVSFVIPVGTP
jgi:hypothetical protein